MSCRLTAQLLPDPPRDIAQMAVSGHVSAAAAEMCTGLKTVLKPLSGVIVGPPALHHNASCTSQPVSVEASQPIRFMRRPLDRERDEKCPYFVSLTLPYPAPLIPLIESFPDGKPARAAVSPTP